MRKIFLFSVLFILIISGCELFAPEEDPDFLANLDAEIAWANAARLTVTVVYPQEWGTSPQLGTNRCFDNKRTEQTPRAGYEFNVQFSSNPIYGEAEWRAYRTKDLPAGSDWYINSTSITEELKDIDKKMLTAEEINFSPKAGSLTTVTSYISDAITIIPWSQPQPRIVSSSPPLSSTETNPIPRNPNREISITFAAPVDPGTLKFEEGFIEITGNDAITGEPYPAGSDGNMKDYFILPLFYDAENYTLRIQSKGNIPTGLIMNVKLGKEIKSPGSELGLTETNLWYLTSESETRIESVDVMYNQNNRRIEVGWKLPDNFPAGGNIILTIRYSINSGSFTTVQLTDYDKIVSDRTFYITGVLPPNANGVRSGNPVSGINRYSIFLDLGEDTRTIDIWNIPGMAVDRNKPTVLLTQETIYTELTAEDSADKYFTLTEDIFLFDWKPVGSEDKPFLGNFYGNGHTITIRSLTGSGGMGLFAAVGRSAIVRDLTVVYENEAGGTVVINPTETTVFGGIAGQATGNAQLLNVLVKGAFHLYMRGSEDGKHIYAGGITGILGRMPGSTDPVSRATINNAYNSLNLMVDNEFEPILAEGVSQSVTVLVGGITGSMGRPIPSITNDRNGDSVTVRNVSVVGDIIVGDYSKPLNVFGGWEDSLLVGGLAGKINGDGNLEYSRAELSNSDYRDGNISIYNERGIVILGGAVGMLYNNAVISDCSSRGRSFTAQKDKPGQFVIGGFIGSTQYSGTISNCYSEYEIEATGGFHVSEFNGDMPSPGIYIGGFIGRASGYGGQTSIIYCYAKRDVSAIGYASIDAGGFVGSATDGVNISSCYAAGKVSVTTEQAKGTISAGGFAGRGSAFSNCYALGDVIADKSNENNVDYNSISEDCIGGFVGQLSGEGLDRCFAKGNIKAQRNINFTSWQDDSIYAGGLVGNIMGGEIKNSAALGTKIEVSGEPGLNKNHFIGRVFGRESGGSSHSAYAYNKMKLFLDGYEIREYVEDISYPKLSGTPEPEGPNDVPAPEAGGTLSTSEYDHQGAMGGMSKRMDISGITISDTSGMGIKSSFISSDGLDYGEWNDKNGTINFINLDFITDKLDINIHLLSLTGSSSVYRITITKINNEYNVEGPLFISSSTEVHSITGLSITHSDNEPLKKVDFNYNGEWGNPFWDGTKIAGLDLSNLENGGSMSLKLTITDITNIYSVYNIKINRDNNGVLSIDPLSQEPESVGGINEIGDGDMSGPHGESTSFSKFMTTTFWLHTLDFNNASGFGIIKNIWNFGSLQGMGHPILNDANGKPMPGQERKQ